MTTPLQTTWLKLKRITHLRQEADELEKKLHRVMESIGKASELPLWDRRLVEALQLGIAVREKELEILNLLLEEAQSSIWARQN